MPTLNVRLAAILVISLAVLGGGVAWLHSKQVDWQASALKAASEKFEADSKEAFKKVEPAADAEKKAMKKAEAPALAEEKAMKKVEAAEDAKKKAISNADAEKYKDEKEAAEAEARKYKAEKEAAEGEAKKYKDEKDAARNEGEKDLLEAIRLLHDYVRLVPRDRGAEIHLGFLYIDSKQLKPAFDTLEDALRLADKSEPPVSPEEIRNARLRLVKDVTMKIGPVEAMKSHLEILLGDTLEDNKRLKRNSKKPTGDAELLDLYGQALIYSRNETGACEIFRDAISIAPDRVDSYLHLASVMRGPLRQEDDADKVMDSMMDKYQDLIKKLRSDEKLPLAENLKLVTAYEKYLSYFLAQNKKDKFEKAFDKARGDLSKLSPDDPRGLLLIGRSYYYKQDYDKAEEYLRKGIKAFKDTDNVAGAYKLLAESQEQAGKFTQAIDTFKKGVKATQGMPSGLDLLWSLADAQILSKNFKDAEPNIKRLREQGCSPPLVDFLEARIAIDQQNWREAERLLKESVIPRTVDSSNTSLRYNSLIFLAQCYTQTNHNVKDRITTLEQATKLSPTAFGARAALAEIYISQGRMADAIEQYREVMKGPQGPQRDQAEFSLARVEIMYLLQTPETAEKKRDWAPVENLLNGLIARKSTHPEYLVLKAEMLLAQEKPQQAREALEESVSAVPKGAEAWLALVRLDIHEAEKAADSAKEAELWKKAARDIDRAEKALGDRVIVRMARGSLALASKDPQNNVGEVLKKLGENTDALNEVEKLQLWSTLGGMCAG